MNPTDLQAALLQLKLRYLRQLSVVDSKTENAEVLSAYFTGKIEAVNELSKLWSRP